MIDVGWQIIMQKIIAFSLWGADPKYCLGAIRNAQLAQKYFSEWKCHFYFDKSVPKGYINVLKDFSNVQIFDMASTSIFGAFWRFLSMENDTIVLSRDCDSRLSEREKHIVDDWLSSPELMCNVKDHINHYEFPILAGMWGLKGGLSREAISGMERYWGTHAYTVDQHYLRDIVWPVYKNTCKNYGIKETVWMRETYANIGKDFIGQTYNEYDVPVYEGKLS